MHCFVSWDINVEDDKLKIKLYNEMKRCLENYSWVQPISNLYIIKIYSIDERNVLKESMIEVCKNNLKKINFIISPTIEDIDENYGGWLPKAIWPEIRKRTNEGFYE